MASAGEPQPPPVDTHTRPHCGEASSPGSQHEQLFQGMLRPEAATHGRQSWRLGEAVAEATQPCQLLRWHLRRTALLPHAVSHPSHSRIPRGRARHCCSPSSALHESTVPLVAQPRSSLGGQGPGWLGAALSPPGKAAPSSPLGTWAVRGLDRGRSVGPSPLEGQPLGILGVSTVAPACHTPKTRKMPGSETARAQARSGTLFFSNFIEDDGEKPCTFRVHSVMLWRVCPCGVLLQTG